VAMNAENNRTPFDLPEAESELVAGFHTEYSGMKFAFFMLGEYSMMLVNSCLMVSLFFGGWTLAMGNVGLTTAVLQGWGIAGGLIGLLIFVSKVMLFMLFYIWTRATFPRFRFDQLMDLGWKWLIPLALVNILVTGVVVLAGGRNGERLLTGIGIAILIATIALTMRPKPQRKVAHASPVSEG
jgi:NADH-quinone oxidoreductase subunit H